MRWQQIAIIIWMAAGLGLALAMDGKPHEGKYSFLSTLISTAVLAAILYTGGFWN